MNDSVLGRFASWLERTYSTEALKVRYPFAVSPSPALFRRFRNPEAEWEVPFHFDFGRFLRDYYAEYVSVLRQYAIDCGVQGVPFFLNIHGTGVIFQETCKTQDGPTFTRKLLVNLDYLFRSSYMSV